MIPLLLRIIIIGLITPALIWAVPKSSEEVVSLLTYPLESIVQVVQSTPMIVEINQKNWNEVVDFSSKLLSQNNRYQGSFKFWYYRALAECALLKINQCSKSWLTASLYAGEHYKSSIEEMQKFLGKFTRPQKSEEQRIIEENSLLV